MLCEIGVRVTSQLRQILDLSENYGAYDVPVVAKVQFSIEVFCAYKGSSADSCFLSDVLHCRNGYSVDGPGDDSDGDSRRSYRVEGVDVTGDNGAAATAADGARTLIGSGIGWNYVITGQLQKEPVIIDFCKSESCGRSPKSDTSSENWKLGNGTVGYSYLYKFGNAISCSRQYKQEIDFQMIPKITTQMPSLHMASHTVQAVSRPNLIYLASPGA